MDNALRLFRVLTNYSKNQTDHQELQDILNDSDGQDWICTEADDTTIEGGHLTPLHMACKLGNLSLVQLLVTEYCHPVHPLTHNGLTPAEVSLTYHPQEPEIWDFLKMECVRSEMIQNALQHGNDVVQANYFKSEVKLQGNVLVDSEQNGVMMRWEEPLMQRHAEVVCGGLATTQYSGIPHLKSLTTLSDQSSQDPEFVVLNVGFGMGIVDHYIHTILQRKDCKCKHIIIEAHPDVLETMHKYGWADGQYGNVELQVIKMPWQDVQLDTLLDGVFFDTFSQDYQAFTQFIDQIVLPLLNEDGVFSYFNGFAGTNAFFYDVYQTIIELDLNEVGLAQVFETLIVKQHGEQEKDVARSYYKLDRYRLPICRQVR